MKNPEAYLEEKVVLPDQEPEEPDSPSLEQAFLSRYFLGASEALSEEREEGQEMARVEPEPEWRQVQVLDRPAPAMEIVEAATEEPAETGQATREEAPREEPTKFVGFFLQAQEYAIPIRDVQEVIKRLEPTRLPLSPDYVSGVINLRGKITPMIDVARLMGKDGASDRDKEFLVVCREGDLQIGLEVERISTMHHVERERIEWALSAHLESQEGYLQGLIKGENLIGILDVAALAQAVVQSPEL